MKKFTLSIIAFHFLLGSSLTLFAGAWSHNLNSGPPRADGLISAGGYHSLCVDRGLVKSWGQNTFGQLGDGTNTDRNVPVPVSVLTGVSAVSAGYQHSLALKSDGTV